MDATLLVPIGLGITVIGAALGIGKFAAAAADARHDHGAAARAVVGAVVDVPRLDVAKRERAAGYVSAQSRGKLSLVDLAGSERASETLNTGHKLRDGANINRSLLALANCINALGKKSQSSHGNRVRENMYVPFRNSKLTRLLKESLSGNSRTAMVANVSCGSDQYAHTVNTLKYADRAKEIRTHVVQNLQTVESHITDYQLSLIHISEPTRPY